MSEQTCIDPIAVEVIGKQLLAAAEEMGVVLVKSSYSTNIKERQDCSTAILDPQGRTVAQAEHIPIHLGSMLGLVENIARRFPLDMIKPGDLFIANDPYNGGGTHLPDITVAAPFFHEGRLLAFVSNIAHHADVGGSPAAPSDIYSEGLRIPPVRVYEAGELRNDVLEMLLLNCDLAGRWPLYRRRDRRPAHPGGRRAGPEPDRQLRPCRAGPVHERQRHRRPGGWLRPGRPVTVPA